jgi:putative phage-type endonuclease
METQTFESAAKQTHVVAASMEPRDVHNPKTKTEWLKLRTQDVTSTESAALFGLSPWMTEFELWHLKKNATVVEHPGNERTEWGKRLESSIALGIADDMNWEVRPMTEYIRDAETRTGASFDYAIEAEEKDSEILNTHGILEIKNVDALQFRDGWIIDPETRSIEAPPHIEMQVQHQLMVSRRDYAYIGALVGGNTVKLMKRRRDEDVIMAIKKKVAAFWNSISLNLPPQPDFEKDASFIAKLYNRADSGTTIPADGTITDLANQYKNYATKEKEAYKKRQAIKAQLLMRIGNIEKVRGDGFSISAGVVASKKIAYTRDQYRNFRVNWSKKK